ncbi:MAG: hypothetical protein JNL79_23260 [Myxococcales bacterium]|nr:hypothetical protein [Myxococcales bacterium]
MSSSQLAYVDASGTKPLLEASAGRQFSAFAVDRIRDVICWTNASVDASPIRDMDLYASPIGSPVVLAPRKVATLRDDTVRGGAAGLVAHDGLVLHLESAQRYVLTQGSSGAQQKFDVSEAAFRLGQVLWVDAKEVWLVGTDPGVPNPASYPCYVLRFERAS